MTLLQSPTLAMMPGAAFICPRLLRCEMAQGRLLAVADRPCRQQRAQHGGAIEPGVHVEGDVLALGSGPFHLADGAAADLEAGARDQMRDLQPDTDLPADVDGL